MHQMRDISRHMQKEGYSRNPQLLSGAKLNGLNRIFCFSPRSVELRLIAKCRYYGNELFADVVWCDLYVTTERVGVISWVFPSGPSLMSFVPAHPLDNWELRLSN